MYILDPYFFHPRTEFFPSQTPGPHKKFKYLTQKIGFEALRNMILVVHPGSGSETLGCWINYFCADAECGGQEADGRAAGGGQEPNGGTCAAGCGHPPLRGRIPGLRASHRQEEDGGPSEQAGSQEQAEGTVTLSVP